METNENRSPGKEVPSRPPIGPGHLTSRRFPVSSMSPLPKHETPVHLELIFKTLSSIPCNLFANKKIGGWAVSFPLHRLLPIIASVLLPFSLLPAPSPFLSLRADAVNWSVLKVHINTQRAKATSWQRNIIITS